MTAADMIKTQRLLSNSSKDGSAMLKTEVENRRSSPQKNRKGRLENSAVAIEVQESDPTESRERGE